MFDGVLECLFLLLGFRNVVNIFTRVFILLLSLASAVLVFLSRVVLFLLFHLRLGLDLLSLTVVEMVVVQMLNFLHVGSDLSAVLGLLGLHRGV